MSAAVSQPPQQTSGPPGQPWQVVHQEPIAPPQPPATPPGVDPETWARGAVVAAHVATQSAEQAKAVGDQVGAMADHVGAMLDSATQLTERAMEAAQAAQQAADGVRQLVEVNGQFVTAAAEIAKSVQAMAAGLVEAMKAPREIALQRGSGGELTGATIRGGENRAEETEEVREEVG